jgi:hypothetical protein
MDEKMILKMAADQFGCDVSDLLSYAIKEGSVIIIAPTGQKFTYDLADLETIHARMVAPRVKAAPPKGAEAAAKRKLEPEGEAQPSKKAERSAKPAVKTSKAPEPVSQAEKPPAVKPPADKPPVKPRASTGGRRRSTTKK